MRKLLFLGVLAAGLASPALAAWQDYQYPDLAFYVTFPAEPKKQDITYTAPDGSKLAGVQYSVEQDSNIYRIQVVDFSNNTIPRTAIVKQAVDHFRALGSVEEDIYARISSDFGRNLNIKLKEGGNDYLSVYFANERKLYIIEGVKLPGSQNAYALRFKELISFITPPGQGRGGAGRGAAAPGGGRGGNAPAP